MSGPSPIRTKRHSGCAVGADRLATEVAASGSARCRRSDNDRCDCHKRPSFLSPRTLDAAALATTQCRSSRSGCAPHCQACTRSPRSSSERTPTPRSRRDAERLATHSIGTATRRLVGPYDVMSWIRAANADPAPGPQRDQSSFRRPDLGTDQQVVLRRNRRGHHAHLARPSWLPRRRALVIAGLATTSERVCKSLPFLGERVAPPLRLNRWRVTPQRIGERALSTESLTSY